MQAPFIKSSLLLLPEEYWVGAACGCPCFMGPLEFITAPLYSQATSQKYVTFLAHVRFGICDLYQGQGVGQSLDGERDLGGTHLLTENGQNSSQACDAERGTSGCFLSHVVIIPNGL